MRQLTDLEPAAAVDAARQAEDHDAAAQHLDRYLRLSLLDFLQNRHGDRDELATALLEAQVLAKRTAIAYFDRWTFLLELLEDSRLVASTVEQIQLLTRREEDVMRRLVNAVLAEEHATGLQPRQLAEELGTSEQNVNNYLRRLERQRLLVRHRVPGQRAVRVYPTRRGLDLAKQLGLWDPPALSKMAASKEDTEAPTATGAARAAEVNPWPGLVA